MTTKVSSYRLFPLPFDVLFLCTDSMEDGPEVEDVEPEVELFEEACSSANLTFLDVDC